MATVFMESERLSFRAPELSDVETITRWMNDARVRMFLDTRVFPLNQLAEEGWVRKHGQIPVGGPTDVVMVFGRKGEDGLVGSAGLHAINWIIREAEWGILIGDPADWDKGYGREVGRRFLSYAFTQLNLNRVRLRVAASHTRALKCYEGTGFVKEGLLRQAHWVDGRYDDTVMMSVLKDEWINERIPRPERPQTNGRAGKKKTSRSRRVD